ncbi:hypothetical protein WJX73_008357 [Symbiochloris irregularis]|uniref:Uncharacterized protein n=1 Tax=Symbiochloris irregularis TaxID=706552 RepID=A0AAW1NXK4_9CHLO
MPHAENSPALSSSTGTQLLLAAGCTSLLGLGVYWLRKRRKYGTLSGVVSYSSRLIAAHRAVEGEQEYPLFQDPLAARLAGPEALKRAQDRSSEPDSSQGRLLGPTAVRTKWFDDRILEALSPSEHVIVFLESQENGACGIKLTLQKVEASAKLQCVCLGAGMDTRPWRLDLPPGVAWVLPSAVNVPHSPSRLRAGRVWLATFATGDGFSS